jgi:2-oxoglutarate dehydrogenase complex dehydrogenase (E1) component-like enzyme
MARNDEANDIMAQTSFLYGGNAHYIEDMYARFQDDPGSVPAEQATRDSVRAIMMIRAFRMRGHLHANLDPLGLASSPTTITTSLTPEAYGFTGRLRPADLHRQRAGA